MNDPTNGYEEPHMHGGKNTQRTGTNPTKQYGEACAEKTNMHGACNHKMPTQRTGYARTPSGHALHNMYQGTKHDRKRSPLVPCEKKTRTEQRYVQLQDHGLSSSSQIWNHFDPNYKNHFN